MLTTCPKCGFNQPQDTYCAKCGVDMANYVPKKKPLFDRIITHPALPVLMVVVAVTSAIVIYRKKPISGPRSHMSFLKGSTGSRAGNMAAAKIDSQTSEDLASTTPNSMEDIGSQNLGEAEATPSNLLGAQVTDGNLPSANTRTDHTPAAVTQGLATRFSIRILEVKEAQLQALKTELQWTEAGDFIAGLLGKKRLETLLSQKIFLPLGDEGTTSSQLPLDLNQKEALNWFVGSKDPEATAAAGLSFVVNYEPASAENIEGEIEVHRDLSDSNGTGIERKSFNLPFSLSPGQILAFTHFLPSQVASAPEAWMNDPLNKFLYSQKYAQTRESNLIILFEIQ